MACQRCHSERTATTSSKSRDMNSGEIDGKAFEGYLPGWTGIGDASGYLEFTWCLDCGQIQGTWPKHPDPEDDE